jgi:hypothetical protein
MLRRSPVKKSWSPCDERRVLVKLDENLSNLHVSFLRERGYEADRVHDQGLSGASDEAVWSRVVAEGRFLITSISTSVTSGVSFLAAIQGLADT